MQLHDLLAYDFVPSELAQLRAAMPEQLLPLQALAVQRGLVSRGGNFLIAGPPASGKSALARLCALHAEHCGLQVLPLTALQAPALLDELRAQPQLLATVDVVLVDGLEGLRDLELGPPLEEFLRQLRRQQRLRVTAGQPPLRLLGFSQLVDGLSSLAQQLSAELVSDGRLPRSLTVGVLHEGRLRTRRHDGSLSNATISDETLVLSPSRGASLLELLAELERQSAPTLIICPDAARGIRLAERLTAQLAHQRSRSPLALSELESTAPGRARALLQSTLRQGVALSSPDLTGGQQAVVERAVARGEVQLLCAVGLPSPSLCRQFRNIVLSSSWHWQRNPATGRWQRTPFDSADCLLLAGRSRPVDGRLLLFARSADELARIWGEQVVAPPRPLVSWGETAGRLSGSAMGQATWQRWAQASRETVALGSLELLTIAALGSTNLSLPLLLSEQTDSDYALQLAALAASLGLAERPLFQWLRQPAERLSHETLRALKWALVLYHWVDGVAGSELESRYHVFIGMIGRVAEEGAVRLEALAKSCQRQGFGESRLQSLQQLAARLRARPIDGVVEHAALASVVPGLQQTIGRLVGALHAKSADRPASAAVGALRPPPRSGALGS